METLERAKDYLTRWYDIEMDDDVRELLLQLVIEKIEKESEHETIQNY
jgi:hypothetical protein